MHILSWRALGVFFVLEFILLGLLSVVGQVPGWIWFVASALLFAGMWAYDHRSQLHAWANAASPTQLIAVGLSGFVLCMVLTVAGTVMFLANFKVVLVTDHPKEPTAQAAPPTPIPPSTTSLDQALLAISSVDVEKNYDPFRVKFLVSNAGRLPTKKVYMSMIVNVVEAHMTQEAADRLFAKRVTEIPQTHMTDHTIAPRVAPFFFVLWDNSVTRDVYEEVVAGRKLLYIFLAADYIDAGTPPGKRMVTEVGLRASPDSATRELNWSLVRSRSFLSDN